MLSKVKLIILRRPAVKVPNPFTPKNYPTRTVEYAFSWLMIAWSYSILSQPEILAGNALNSVYKPMLDIMPAAMWGWVGFIIGGMRIAALVINGSWKPTPELRLVGASWGVMFWVALVCCHYISVVNNGAPDFPMRRAILVFVFFEAYSCYRCGQDIGRRDKVASDFRGSVDAGYG